MRRSIAASCLAAVVCGSLCSTVSAREYFVGGPLHVQDMEIVANYLVGVQMAPMTAGMPQGADVIHLEADVHATADNKYGYPDGAWIAYLPIHYGLEKVGTPWRTKGLLKPMTAKDGPHYADNVKMAGPGKYKLTYDFSPPEVNGFYRHVDKETGVPGWWKPFTATFVFSYPQR